MKAYVFKAPGIIEKDELPQPFLDVNNETDRKSAILRPRFLSPCSSDVHTVFQGNGPRRPGLVLGHEGLAEIVSCGPEVKDFRPGELVAVSAVMPEPGDIAGHRGMPFSASKLGRNIDGMWSELFKVPEADLNLAHLPDGVTTKAALMAVDMMATGYTAAEEAKILPGETIVVIGSGAVGLMAVQAARAAAGPEGRVIVLGSDRDPVHAELAGLFGADAYLSYRSGEFIFGREMPAADAFAAPDPRANSTGSPAVDTVFSVIGVGGADRVLICGGGHEALAQASDLVRYGSGVVVNMAYLEGSGMVPLPIFSLGRGMAGKTFRFCLSRGGRAWTERMLALAKESGNIQERLVTHTLKGFDEIPHALQRMKERPMGMIKIMVEI